MNQFEAFNLPKTLLQSLEKLGFTEPTPIQSSAIPQALEGKDILGSAQTGTGKTAAFGIPLITHLLNHPSQSALVLTPTRELAVQVMKMLKNLLGQAPIKAALLIGGEPIFKQFQQLKVKPRLIIGTPGRINDHLMRGRLPLDKVDFLVLDETDRMLDMGFSEQIDAILEHVPQKRQTLLFSATLPKNIVKMAEKYMHEPVRISVGSTTLAAPLIKQDVLRISEQNKYKQLTTELLQRDGSIIVFVKTKHNAEQMTNQLRREQHSVDTIHGDLRQRQRERAIKGFRDSKYRIMVATDIAARGLDIAHVKHVINYDLPQCPEDYIHRIGRTARAGAEGFALSFVTPSEQRKWTAIDRLINPNHKPEKDPYRGGSSKSSRGGSGSGQKKKWFQSPNATRRARPKTAKAAS